MKKIVTLGLVAGSLLTAGGYKIPEQSLNAVALGAAYVAHTTGADTAYYNPANMAFLGDDRYIEGGLTLAHLPSIRYRSGAPLSGKTRTENIAFPNLYYVSKPMENFRWGISLNAPGGLTKRWDAPFEKAFAQEFTLKILELNPSVSYRVTDRLAIGGGVRLIYSEGVVKSDGLDANIPLRREMKGNAVEFGYNLAVSYRPLDDLILAATYRSNVNIKEEGDANLYLGGIGKQFDADVTVPLPAALNMAISKTLNDVLTLEFDYERTFWSKYKALDFNYKQPILSPALKDAFDAPIPRNWKDTNTFRIGATLKMNDKTTLMTGIAFDDTPVPAETLGFELPDSDAKILSFGIRYRQNKHLSWGAALLYADKESRNIAAGTNGNRVLANGGTFDGGGAFLTTIGVTYRY